MSFFAVLFALLQTQRRNMTSYERFRAQLVGGDGTGAAATLLSAHALRAGIGTYALSGVAAGALITIRFPAHWDRRHLLMACYAMQACGILLGVWWPSLPGFALGSLLIGLPFTAITLFAMQEVRRLRPHGTRAGG